MRISTVAALSSLAASLLVSGCMKNGSSQSPNTTPTDATHDKYFPIAAGTVHALGSGAPPIDCNSCHGATTTFKEFDCTTCHAHSNQASTDRGHLAVPNYVYASVNCYSCHARGTSDGTAPAGPFFDPARDVTVTAQVPAWSALSIASVTSTTEAFHMVMEHSSKTVPAATIASCASCHSALAAGSFLPGLLHASLAKLQAPQPTGCLDCHASAAPRGFVGPAAQSPVRVPSTGEMRHDAVAWSAGPSGAPTATALVTQDCKVCHVSPAQAGQSWASSPASATGPALFHASLTGAAAPQPGSCIDCHANSRPAAILTHASAATLPAGLSFDHRLPEAQADCVSCHTATNAWPGGKYHLPGSQTPASCLPCHAGEQPASTASWKSNTYTSAPFDYALAQSTTLPPTPHGGGLDCAACHTGPGTGGAWGGTQTWVGGRFAHGPGAAPDGTCIACHTSQRPDRLIGAAPANALLAFDHAAFGAGDCNACHQATVVAGAYAVPFTKTSAKNQSDWGNGTPYPGTLLVGSQVIATSDIGLVRVGGTATGLVTGTTRVASTARDYMLHTWPGLSAYPAGVQPGPQGNPNSASCAVCHTTDSTGAVSTYLNGAFHASLQNYQGPGAPLAPPAACNACHTQTPQAIVEKSGSDLQPMDHSAKFTAAVSLNGVSVTGVAQMECVACHKSQGSAQGQSFADGVFHANVGAAVPADCTACHYVTMADTAVADLAKGADYAMRHASAQVPFQACQKCHTGALATAGSPASLAGSGWAGGLFHASLTAPATGCLDCHTASRPAGVLTSANSGLPSGLSYDHSTTLQTDCTKCHTSATVWTGGKYHLATSAAPTSCLPCHDGERPVSASAWTSTTYKASPFDYTPAQSATASAHGAGLDCIACHAAPSGATETWANGNYQHATSVLNTVSCATCHTSQRPDRVTSTAAATLQFDHAANGAGDCIGCHQATLAAQTFKVPFTATTARQGSDWKNGAAYPGPAPVGSRYLDTADIALIRSGPGNLVTGESPYPSVVYDEMVHTWSGFANTAVYPAALNPGASGNAQSCWHCHAHDTNGNVTSFAGGQFHAALSQYRTTVTGTVTPLQQPAGTCNECHTGVPQAIVELGGSDLVPMDHAAPFNAAVSVNGAQVTSVAQLDCVACHRTTLSATGAGFADGKFHANVPAAALQAADCTTCHYVAMADRAMADVSQGANTASAYTTPNFLMAHESPQLAVQNCQQCHLTALAKAVAATPAPAQWATGKLHASLVVQPSGCLDCHARPVMLMAAPAAALPAGLSFDHGAAGSSDCTTCHTRTDQWAGGKYHLASSAAPSTCLPCHAGERPATTSGWKSASYTSAPFDYTAAQSASGAPHGNGLDCVTCHAGPGTGAWGGTQNWVAGQFTHGAGTASGTSCLACHTSQRPDRVLGSAPAALALLGFDHAASGTGDCLGCHQATHRYSLAFTATTPAQSSDWAAGVAYPAGRPVGTKQITTTDITLARSGANNLVTGTGTVASVNVDDMVHTWAGFTDPAYNYPAGLNPASASSCWHCHTHDASGNVTSYTSGQFHPALAAFSAALGGAVTPLKQPTSRCNACHLQTPLAIIERNGSDLRPMDHTAAFNGAVTLGGLTVTGVAQMDCATCHKTSASANGGSFSDGVFHANIGAAVPTDCTVCHYVTMADSAGADVAQAAPAGAALASNFAMKHASPQLAFQNCQKCHATALAASLGSAAAPLFTQWATGKLHASVAPQPSACLDCHAAGRPLTVLTSGNAALPSGLAFDHGASGAGECATCHTSPTAWSGGRFHLAGSQTPGSCLPCHSGERPTTTSAWKSPGYASTPFDYTAAQSASGLPHGAGLDCVSCHAGPGTAGTWGGTQTWTGGRFAHGAGTLSATTCTACHTSQRPDVQMGVAPANTLLGFDHAASGTGDCLACHAGTQSYAVAFGGKVAGQSDWSGGVFYPGGKLVGSRFTNTNDQLLTRSAATNLVTGAVPIASSAADQMQHVWSGFANAAYGYPADLNPGAGGNAASCWHCHVHDATGKVSSYAGGLFHASLDNYQATVNGPVTPLPAPPGSCSECHVQTPAQIVEKAASDLEPMDHAALFAAPVVIGGKTVSGVAQIDCATCHQTDNSASGVSFADGEFHANIGAARPADCTVCHYVTMTDKGADPVQAAPAGATFAANYAMLHRSPLVPFQACQQCHATAFANASSTTATSFTLDEWAPGKLHASLTTQPAGCLDCHTASRPAVALTSANATLPAGTSFDHASAGSGECVTCHASTSVWTGGKLHLAGSATPATCLPCHGSERPAATTAWINATYKSAPFDYTAAQSFTAPVTAHGAGLDCVACHANPGTGAWGGTQNWATGRFTHGSATASATACIACHTSQRPDRVMGSAAAAAALLGFDHAASGTGDCIGCHQATVNYQLAFNGTVAGASDWRGGVAYPGSTLVGTKTITVPAFSLTKSATTGLATGTSATTWSLTDQMLHTWSGFGTAAYSAQFGFLLTADPSAAGKCYLCHTHNAQNQVTSFANGFFHTALSAQPAGACDECHTLPLPTPPVFVEKAGSDLQPMDHSAVFTAPVTIAGVAVAGVPDLQCIACHSKTVGTAFNDGVFHSNIGAAVPADCTLCHYVTMADKAKADLASGVNYAMVHGSAQVTFQSCQPCHTTALANAVNAAKAGTAPAGAQWATGAFHPGVTKQPVACLDCHAVSKPAAITQSSVSYTLPLGGTTTNALQWMNHAQSDTTGKDCVLCHAADAKTAGSAWSKADLFHAKVTSPATCWDCHGLKNTGGTTPGASNNLPLGNTNSITVTSAVLDTTTGVPAGTLDQISHADVNVTAFDCDACHTQAGQAAAAPVKGKEWAQATFHAQFLGTTTLTLNGTTGRCSDCHLNVMPTAVFTKFSHAGLTAASGSTDCKTCHSYPGLAQTTPPVEPAPNWLGAAGAPPYITVGGFTIPAPPAATPIAQAGINSLPHPSTAVNACTACHTQATGGTNATGYDHASTLISANCAACHEAGSNLVSAVWNGKTTQTGGAGDTRPFTITTLIAYKGGAGGDTCKNVNTPNHFYPVDCKECHTVSTTTVSTATAYATNGGGPWLFPHKENNMASTTCNLCHSTPNCGR